MTLFTYHLIYLYYLHNNPMPLISLISYKTYMSTIPSNEIILSKNYLYSSYPYNTPQNSISSITYQAQLSSKIYMLVSIIILITSPISPLNTSLYLHSLIFITIITIIIYSYSHFISNSTLSTFITHIPPHSIITQISNLF